jgi:hypothetical protein
MTVANTLEVAHGLFDNLMIVMDSEQCYSCINQTIDEMYVPRRQGVDGWRTTSFGYVQSPWNSQSS